MSRNVFAFDRADAIGTRILLLLIVISAGALAVIRPVIDWLQGHPFRSVVPGPEGMDRAVSGITIQPGVKVQASDQLQVTISDPSNGLRGLDLAAGSLVFLGVLICAWLIHKLLSQIMSGEPFTGSSVWWLRGIAGVLLIGPWIHLPFVMARNGMATGQALDTSGATFSMSLPMSLFILPVLGLLAAALGEAFARGKQLQEDSEGLI